MTLELVRHLSPGAGSGAGAGSSGAGAPAFLFPGQGAQTMGMADGLLSVHPGARSPGTMVSILGLSEPQVEEVVARARPVGPIGIANYNSPSQFVVSGAREAVEAAAAAAKALGCRRAIPLRVAGAYHSPLMA